MRLESVTFDARDVGALAQWWAEALGWTVVLEAFGEELNLAERVNEDGSHPHPELSFVPVPDPAAGQERVHLDLNSHSFDEQSATVERLLAMGATYADVGQASDAPFVVLADPEGNHLCVLDPRPELAHLGSLAGLTLAVHDVAAVRDLWIAATGWLVDRDDVDYLSLSAPGHGVTFDIITRPTMARDDRKDRIHVDVAPAATDDQSEVVTGLEALGATRADVGQSDDVTWVVLADLEGNELCVLSPRD